MQRKIKRWIQTLRTIYLHKESEFIQLEQRQQRKCVALSELESDRPISMLFD